MMLNREINIIHQFTVWFFFLAILSQYVIESPVLCLESDGQINIETDCNYVPIQKDNNHQVDCFDCIDIPFWNYNPDLLFLVKSADFDFDVYKINQELFIHELAPDLSSDFQTTENPQNHFPPFLTYTVLLI